MFGLVWKKISMLVWHFLLLANSVSADSLVNEPGTTFNVLTEQACHAGRVKLRCPQQTNIIIVDAFYGRAAPSSDICPLPPNSPYRRDSYEDTTCRVDSAVEIAKRKCEFQQRCRLKASPQIFAQDPCPTTAKYLQVAYYCKPSQFMVQDVCFGRNFDLKCKRHHRLSFLSAKYGSAAPGADQVCKDATTSLPNCTVDVLSQLSHHCQALPSCTISTKLFQSPCPLDIVLPQLTFAYACVNESIFTEEAQRRKVHVAPHVVSSKNSQSARSNESSTNNIMVTTVHPIKTRFEFNQNDAAIPIITRAPLSTTQIPSTAGTNYARRLPVSTCLPPEVPNAFSLATNIIATVNYMKEHYKEVILCFCLSASLGLVVILGTCIAGMIRKFYRLRKPEPKIGTIKYRGRKNIPDTKLSERQPPSPPMSFYDDRSFEMRDLGRNGAFVRFSTNNNNGTPNAGGRNNTLNHYYT